MARPCRKARGLDVVYALVKRVANEVGVVGVLRTKANGREIKACVAQPTQVVLAIRGWLRPPLRWQRPYLRRVGCNPPDQGCFRLQSRRVSW